MSKPTPKTVIITGDLVLDHHLYEGERVHPMQDKKRGILEHVEWGGAALLQRLISQTVGERLLDVLHDKLRQEAKDNGKTEPPRPQPTEVEEILNNLRGRDVPQVVNVRLAVGDLPEPNATAFLRTKAKEITDTEDPRHLGAHLALIAAQVESAARGYALFRPFPRGPKDAKSVWRVSRPLGYGPARRVVPPPPPAIELKPQVDQHTIDAADVIVIDDAGGECRRLDSQATNGEAAAWCLPSTGTNPHPWIILKLSGPMQTGDLWQRIQARKDLHPHLVVVVPAKHIRFGHIRLSRGLSWERSVEHLLAELQDNPDLSDLSRIPRHLIVHFGLDGAVWIDFSDREHPKVLLVYDAAHAEGEWAADLEGDAFSYQTCLAAALGILFSDLGKAAAVTSAKIANALCAGLSAMRRLRVEGHGPTTDKNGQTIFPRGFPTTTLAQELRQPGHRFALVPVPAAIWTKAKQQAGAVHQPWTILSQAQFAPSPPTGSTQNPKGLHGLAWQLVLRGEVALGSFPHLRIGKLLTADRSDMEMLRALRRQLTAYAHSSKPGSKPLSLGVFGAPGAGKSFGVKQLAAGIFGGAGAKDYRGWLEFNLSQFNDVRDLLGAFHQVRDLVLQGTVPVVFWDEFDTGNYKWLQYLLAPMQDGRFQAGQVTHTLGKSVFVFAGGTAWTFEAFGEFKSAESASAFALAKGPDFKSRLDGYYNVLGPNPRRIPPPGPSPAVSPDWGTPNSQWVEDPADIFFPIRRALLIRAQLGCKPGERLEFDPGLLTALLRTSGYAHGARSLEKVLEPIRNQQNFLGQRREPVRSSLPAPSQMRMHLLDPDGFFRLCHDYKPTVLTHPDKLDLLARKLHDNWRKEIHTRKETNKNDVDFDDLVPDVLSANLAASRRIPDVLAMAGLKVVEDAQVKSDPAAIVTHLQLHLELLAEAEHDGWMEDRKKFNWSYDPKRDDDARKHPCLRPFSELEEYQKEKDRNTIRQYPDSLALVGLAVEFADTP